MRWGASEEEHIFLRISHLWKLLRVSTFTNFLQAKQETTRAYIQLVWWQEEVGEGAPSIGVPSIVEHVPYSTAPMPRSQAGMRMG